MEDAVDVGDVHDNAVIDDVEVVHDNDMVVAYASSTDRRLDVVID